ncbi:hypothetical protein ACI3PL_28660, partial [Lacticaseibacillus paracasei]
SIAITSGDTVSITATGTVVYNNVGATTTPAGTGGGSGTFISVSDGVGTLLARVGTSGAWHSIGAAGSFLAAATDSLYLIMN